MIEENDFMKIIIRHISPDDQVWAILEQVWIILEKKTLPWLRIQTYLALFNEKAFDL